MRMDLPAPVLHALFSLNEAGFEAYIVGGGVRNALIGIAPADWDIATSALPEQTLAVLQNYRTIETGIRHGTVTVIIDDMPLEITTYRVDGDYSDGRHPDKVTYTRNLKEDLRRRDFTMNAMAYHPHIGLVDPFRGRRDIQKRVIRCVGRPKKRFTEDALRILRGLRFASIMGFSIKPSTAKAIHRLGHTLPHISAERIATEIVLLLWGDNVKAILTEYADVLSYVFPNVDIVKSANRVSAVNTDPISRLGALMFDLTPEEAEESCKNLKFSSRITKDVTTLVRYRHIPLEPERSNVLRALNTLGADLLPVMLDLRTITDARDYTNFRTIWNQLESDNALCYRIKDIAVTGDDLMTLGFPSGPEIGATLCKLLDAVIAGDCPNQKAELLQYVVKTTPKTSGLTELESL